MTPETSPSPRALVFVNETRLDEEVSRLSGAEQVWVRAHGFVAERGRVLVLGASQNGDPRTVWVGLGARGLDLALAQSLPDRLPAGDYTVPATTPAEEVQLLGLGFALASYRFARYKAVTACAARFVAPVGHPLADLGPVVRADTLARDLINASAQDLGPAQLGNKVAEVAAAHGARFEEVVGEDLLAKGFPAVHAVGRSGAQPPRLLTLRAGGEGPLVALVGKGVCFDSGGLNLKPASGMALMKKDMGGAAVALALADLVLTLRIPVRLLLVIPAVENAVGPNAFRPGDVLATRAGPTVEVTNTDAEGRLVLADALAYAAEAKPDLLIDFATLTGAARVALGPELPALYASEEGLAEKLAASGRATADPVWPMPLWPGYEDELQSKVADLQNASSSGFAGSITAALFLRRFVPQGLPWLHLDLYAWNPRERPGRPLGAEAQTLRAVTRFLQDSYPSE